MRWLPTLALVNLPLAALAQELSLPINAVLQREQAVPATELRVPMGPFVNGQQPVDVLLGDVRHQAWRISTAGLTTFQILEPLEAQLREAGYTIHLSCETQLCGGFDFRFSLDVLPPPAMFVDLGNFRFLSAQRGENAVLILVSRSDRAGFVHLTELGGETDGLAEASAPAVRPTINAAIPGDFATALEADGRVILADLTFDTGSASLGTGEFASLQALADYLISNPDRQVALVGHTDAEGSLNGNIALSRRRAEAVLERLVSDYGVPRQQLEGQGMGYLAPIASNLTAEGRDANRRVEVIVTSTP